MPKSPDLLDVCSGDPAGSFQHVDKVYILDTVFANLCPLIGRCVFSFQFIYSTNKKRPSKSSPYNSTERPGNVPLQPDDYTSAEGAATTFDVIHYNQFHFLNILIEQNKIFIELMWLHFYGKYTCISTFCIAF